MSTAFSYSPVWTLNNLNDSDDSNISNGSSLVSFGNVVLGGEAAEVSIVVVTLKGDV